MKLSFFRILINSKYLIEMEDSNLSNVSHMIECNSPAFKEGSIINILGNNLINEDQFDQDIPHCSTFIIEDTGEYVHIEDVEDLQNSSSTSSVCMLCNDERCTTEINTTAVTLSSNINVKIIDVLFKLLQSTTITNKFLNSDRNYFNEQYLANNIISICRNCTNLIDVFNFCTDKCTEIVNLIKCYLSPDDCKHSHLSSNQRTYWQENQELVPLFVKFDQILNRNKCDNSNTTYHFKETNKCLEIDINDPIICKKDELPQYDINATSDILDVSLTDKLKKINKSICPFCFNLDKHQNGIMHNCSEYRESLFCHICNTKFTSINRLEQHLKIIHLFENYNKCPLQNCVENFATSLGLKCHLYMYHPWLLNTNQNQSTFNLNDGQIVNKQEFAFIKPNSSQINFSSNNLSKASDFHAGKTEKSIKNDTFRYNYSLFCQICGKKMPNKSRLMAHLISHSGNRPFKCSLCIDRTFKRKSALSKHMKIIHTHQKNLNTDKLTCTKCGAVYKTKVALDDHILLHNEENASTGLWPYTCNICHKKLSGKKSLDIHIKYQHNDTSFKCNYCFKSFKSKLCLNLHLQRIHKVGNQEFQCPICDKGFLILHDLKRHINKHKTEKNFECMLCQSKYKCLSRLKNHMKVHYKGEKLSCPLCFVPSISFTILKEHMQAVHQISHIKENVNSNNMCIICGQIFLSCKTLSQHMKDHMNNEETEFVFVEESAIIE